MIDAYLLFNENIALVYSVIRKYDINNQDLFQAGCIGLFKACLKYDELKSSLSTFAVPYITFEVKKELRNGKIRLSRAVFPIINYIKNNEKYEVNELMEKFKVSRNIVLSALYYKCIDIFDETTYISEKNEINDYLDDLNEQEKRIIILYFKRNLYKNDIAKLCHCSLRKVSNIINKALEKITQSIK